jgi:hypothetical protein
MTTDITAEDQKAPLDLATAARRKAAAADVATSSLLGLDHAEWSELCANLESWVDEPPPAG